MTELLTARGRELVEARVAADSPWCFPCGLAGLGRVPADLVYNVSHQDAAMMVDVVSCAAHFRRAFADQVNVVASRPVEIPDHVKFLRCLDRKSTRLNSS